MCVYQSEGEKQKCESQKIWNKKIKSILEPFFSILINIMTVKHILITAMQTNKQTNIIFFALEIFLYAGTILYKKKKKQKNIWI